jgi:hypothetical protein
MSLRRSYQILESLTLNLQLPNLTSIRHRGKLDTARLKSPLPHSRKEYKAIWLVQ